jgi:hypothetical protein
MKKGWWLTALAICLVLVTISPLASSSPDGLEKVAADKGFSDTAGGAPFNLLADYIFPGIENEVLATILAGWLGTLLLFAVVYSLAWLIRMRKVKHET